MGKAVAEKRVGVTYDGASQAATLSRYANLAGTQVVAHTEYDFDLAGRRRGMEHFKGGTTFADYDWTYDAASRMTAFDSLVDGTAAYTNDATGQLTGADYDYQADETYVYDENGNRVNNGYTVGANNQMTSDGTYRYLYDAEGNRTRRFVDANSNGLLDSGDTDVTEYAWDHRNRLTEVTHRAAYGAAADMVVENSYDFANRWVRKILDDDGDGTRDYTQVFAYDGNQIVLDFHRNGPCGMQVGHLRERYLWGPAVDQILAEEAVDGGGAENVLWTLTDHLNTVRDLAQYNPGTDTTTVLNHLVYSAFGEVTSETNAAVNSLFLFTARPFDEDTGLQNNLNRWYDPAVGRWVSEDPIGFGARDANLYRYSQNTPSQLVDADGLKAIGTDCGPWSGWSPWSAWALVPQNLEEECTYTKTKMRSRSCTAYFCWVPVNTWVEFDVDAISVICIKPRNWLACPRMYPAGTNLNFLIIKNAGVCPAPPPAAPGLPIPVPGPRAPREE